MPVPSSLGPSRQVSPARESCHESQQRSASSSDQMIRFVTFDALHTLITPRKPIHVQYAEVFCPYLGTLPPDAIARSLKLGVHNFPYSSLCVRLRKHGTLLALRQLQVERPAYRAGVERWWREVISRTAVGAGADPQAVERHLGAIVPSLMKRFSSREGYRLFDDTLVTRTSSLLVLHDLETRVDMR